MSTITSIHKAQLGVEDIALDVTGNNETFTRKGSKNQPVRVRRFNASHLPVSANTRLQDGHDGSDNECVNVDAAILKVFQQLFDIGKPDGATVEANGSGGSRILRLKDLGVSSAKLQDNAVTTAKIAALAITTALVDDGAISADKIAALAITAAKLANDSVTGDKIQDSAVTAAKIADGAIGKAKFNLDGLNTDPGGFIVEVGTHTLSGGAVTEAKALNNTPGASDHLIAIPKSITNSHVNLETAGISGSNASYHFNNDPGAATEITYMVIRPVTT